MPKRKQVKVKIKNTIKAPFMVNGDAYLVLSTAYGRPKHWIGISASDMDTLRNFFQDFLGEELDETNVKATVLANFSAVSVL